VKSDELGKVMNSPHGPSARRDVNEPAKRASSTTTSVLIRTAILHFHRFPGSRDREARKKIPLV
jgi:hypothetical protein